MSAIDVSSSDEILHDKSVQVLNLLESLGLSFGDFAVAVCHGNQVSHKVEIVERARASLYETDNLKTLLNNSYSPPRDPDEDDEQPIPGRGTITSFALSTTQEIFREELHDFSLGQTLSDAQLADSSHVATIGARSLYKKVKTKCPNLLVTLARLGGREINDEDDEDGKDEDSPMTGKHPHLATIQQITALAYRSNPQRNAFPKLLGLYFYMNRTDKASFSLLHQCGLVVSYATIQKSIKQTTDGMTSAGSRV